MKLAAAALALLAGLCASACQTMLQPSAKPLSKLEARNMTYDAVTRRAGELLVDALIYHRIGNESRRPVAVLSELYFDMKPRSSGWKGLCSITAVTLHFAPEVSAGADARTPTTVTNVTTSETYRFLDKGALANKPDEMTERELDRANDQCSRLDPGSVDNFNAESPYEAYYGAKLYQLVLSELKTGKPSFEVTCPNEDSCKGMFDRLDPYNVWEIRMCGEQAPGRICQLIRAGGLSFDIVFAGRLEEPHVQSVRAYQEVVIADYTID